MERRCDNLRCRPREGGDPVPQALPLNLDVRGYWMPACAGMTASRFLLALLVTAEMEILHSSRMTRPTLDFWFEFASTYSYPAAMRIGAAAQGAKRWRLPRTRRSTKR